MGKIKSKGNYRKKFVSIFGFLGYMFCVFQWFWVLVLYSSLLKLLTNIIPNNADDKSVSIIAPSAVISEPSVFMIFLGVIIMGAAIALMIYSFMRIPSAIVRTNKKMISQVVEFSAPVASKIQHKPDNENFRLKITPSIVIVIKVLLVIVPIVFGLASGLLSEQFMDYNVSIYISFGLSLISLMLFSFQYLLAYLLYIEKSDIL